MKAQSGNFGFLEAHDVQLVRLGALAERYFHDDPNTCLIKLRQFAELLGQLIAAKTGLYEAGDESQADLLRRLRFERVLPPQVADLFHTLRILGNNAAHGAAGTLSEALNALKYARQAGVWFHRTFGQDPSTGNAVLRPSTRVDCRYLFQLLRTPSSRKSQNRRTARCIRQFLTEMCHLPGLQSLRSLNSAASLRSSTA